MIKKSRAQLICVLLSYYFRFSDSLFAGHARLSCGFRLLRWTSCRPSHCQSSLKKEKCEMCFHKVGLAFTGICRAILSRIRKGLRVRNAHFQGCQVYRFIHKCTDMWHFQENCTSFVRISISVLIYMDFLCFCVDKTRILHFLNSKHSTRNLELVGCNNSIFAFFEMFSSGVITTTLLWYG